ncbi:hypothetical protein [Pseudoneobacillus sp. C159]
MEAFPIIHTNFWDAVIAVPLVVILTQIIKKLFPVAKPLVPGVANGIGLIISIFFAHRHNLWAGFFMGFFYGNAAVGLYASLKTQIKAYRGQLNI